MGTARFGRSVGGLLLGVGLAWGAGAGPASAAPASAAPASAASSPSAGDSTAAPGLRAVHPGPQGYFELDLGPGATTRIAVVVHNFQPVAETYLLYQTDATTSQVTGVQYGQRRTPAVGVGAWLTPAVGTLRLGPGAAEQVSVTVTVPQGVGPGDHVGAIAAQSPNLPSGSVGGNGHGTNVNLITTTRVVIAVVVHVPGPAITALQLGRPSLSTQDGVRQFLAIPMVDTGELLFKPLLTGGVTPCRGGPPVVRIDQQLDTFVPKTAISYAYNLARALPAGCYTVHLGVYDAASALSSVTGNVSVTAAQAAVHPRTGAAPTAPAAPAAGSPGFSRGAWYAVLAALGALLLLALFLLLLLLRRRREPEQEPEPAAPPPAPSPPAPGNLPPPRASRGPDGSDGVSPLDRLRSR
ncbi:MAG: WxL protein peptidoglycan domain-containing protein [Mycobacteriales bacterium]